MRLLIACILCLTLAAGLSAQDITPVTCPDVTPINPQMTINLPAQPPATKDDLPGSYFVSVITDQNIPTLAATNANGAVTCAVQDGLAQSVSVNYAQQTDQGVASFGPSPYSAWVGSDAADESTVSVGNIVGETFIVIEGGRITNKDGAGDIYTLAIDPALLKNLSLQAYTPHVFVLSVEDIYVSSASGTNFVLSVDDTYVPSVSIIDDEGKTIQSENLDTCTGDNCSRTSDMFVDYTGLLVPHYSSAPILNIFPPQQQILHIRVDNTQTEGLYTLIIELDIPVAQPKASPAQAIPNGDGSWTLRCDGQEAFTNGVKVSLDAADPSSISPESPLTLTALGADSPVTMAVFTSPTEGYCAPIAPDTSTYSLTLPDLDVSPTLNSAQVKLESQPAFVLVGSAQPSALTLLVEGWKTPLRETLVTEENPDLATILQPLLTLDVTPALINSGSEARLYAVASDDIADAALGVINVQGQLLTNANGEVLACNDAGVPDRCPSDSTSLNGYTLTLGDGRVLPGASLDAMLRVNPTTLIPEPDAALGADLPKLHIAAADRTGAGGPLIFAISFTLSE